MNEYITTNENGDKFYYNNKAKTVWHREDGPAAVWDNGRKKAWYFNGKLHRIDGPAVEFVNDYNAWYVNDELIFEIDINGNIVDRMK